MRSTCPSWQAFVTELVPKEDLLNAVTLNSAQFNAARAIGPALGGLILATLGPSWAFILNAISYAAVILAVWLVRVSVRHIVPTGQHVLADFVDACRYVRRHAAILMCILLVFAVAFLANPMLQLSAVFTDRVFHAGAAGLGVLMAAFGTGAVLATPLVSALSSRLGRGRLVAISFTMLSCSVISFGLATELWVGILAMLADGHGLPGAHRDAEHNGAAGRRRAASGPRARGLLHDVHGGVPARVTAPGMARGAGGPARDGCGRGSDPPRDRRLRS